MKKVYQPGAIIRTLAGGLEGIIIDSEEHFTGTYIRYVVEMRYGETTLLGAQDFADRNDPIHIALDEARLLVKPGGVHTVYLAWDNGRSELIMLHGDKSECYDQLEKAQGNLKFYRELCIGIPYIDTQVDTSSVLSQYKFIDRTKRAGQDVKKVRIKLNWEDAVAKRFRYFDNVEELAVFFRSNPALARVIGYGVK